MGAAGAVAAGPEGSCPISDRSSFTLCDQPFCLGLRLAGTPKQTECPGFVSSRNAAIFEFILHNLVKIRYIGTGIGDELYAR